MKPLSTDGDYHRPTTQWPHIFLHIKIRIETIIMKTTHPFIIQPVTRNKIVLTCPMAFLCSCQNGILHCLWTYVWEKKKRWFQFSHCELSFSSTCIWSICLLVFSGVYVAQSAVFCVVLCWPLYCLSFELQLLNLWNLQSSLSSFLFLI